MADASIVKQARAGYIRACLKYGWALPRKWTGKELYLKNEAEKAEKAAGTKQQKRRSR